MIWKYQLDKLRISSVLRKLDCVNYDQNCGRAKAIAVQIA